MNIDPLEKLAYRTRCIAKDLEAKPHNAPGSNWCQASATSLGRTSNSTQDHSQGGLVYYPRGCWGKMKLAFHKGNWM